MALVEARHLLDGVTGYTTAKVSALQSTRFSTITSRHGAEAAAIYAEATLAGVTQVLALADQEGLKCELERQPAFTYAADEQG